MTAEEQLKAAMKEVTRLREMVAVKDEKITSLDARATSQAATITAQIASISKLDAAVRELEDQLAWLRKKVFGKMSEKHLPLDPAQLSLFDRNQLTGEQEKAELAKAVEESQEEITRMITVKSKPSRKPLDTTKLPVEVEDIYPEGTTDENGSLKAGYVEIGIEETSRLERIPAKVYIVRTVRHKIISKSDITGKHPEERSILVAALPLAPVSKCIAGASVLADIITGKFMYHLPFYRQIQQYKEAGITISDSTMGGWYEAAVEKLKLLYDLLRKQILSSEYIQIDESVIPVIDNEKHRTRKGYEWCVRDAITGDVMFHYDRGSRGGHVARELLGSFRGCVQSDGYEAYDQFEKVEGITLHGCWAHARRKYCDALEENKSLATEAICYIRKLYKVEEEADRAGLTPEQRCEKRQKESYPVILTFEKWMMGHYREVLPQSRTAKAIAYTYTLLPRLSRYVNDGRINIDNNLIENNIRPLALGRKNFLFCGNDASAYRAAIVYSLIGTCKAAGVEPREWLEDVLKKIPYYLSDGRDMTGLLPRTWANSASTRD
ncbi:MAG: IS66 family transposase [Petrimonas sp.]|uniref:IS66 family transposase n=1 Tax=Petrimonas sp. TaxID=2023866 RepID=UPI000A815F3E|nr:IS66 family transposase [Petrimonas sp.]